MRKKNFFTILLWAVLALGMIGVTGCGKDADKSGNGDGASGTAEQTYRVALFFANEEYIATGDESLEKFIVNEHELTSKPGDAYKDALELLRTAPDESCSTVINDQVKFNDVYLDGDTAVVDLAGGLKGGSLEESFLIGQIVDTLMNSFDEVKQVQFLVDGQKAETLMGHVDAGAPFAKDVFTE